MGILVYGKNRLRIKDKFPPRVSVSHIPVVTEFAPDAQYLCADEGVGAVRPDPALCHLGYTMSKTGGVTDFVRQYTLASGGSYCDCGYKKKIN